MSPPRVLVEREGPVTVLVLDHPASRNGLGPAMRAGLAEAFEQAVADPAVEALVVTGAGGWFSAGSDIGAIGDQDLHERVERLDAFQRFLSGWGDVAKPVLVAVEGAAAGGGVSLALSADWAVAASDATFVSGWVKLGVAPDAGALWWLTRGMGAKQAWDWLHSTRPLDAEAACASGIVTAVCSPGQARTVAVERARRVVALPRTARAVTKRLLRRAASTPDLEAFLAAELYAQAYLFGGDEHRGAVEAFLAARSDRRPEGA